MRNENKWKLELNEEGKGRYGFEENECLKKWRKSGDWNSYENLNWVGNCYWLNDCFVFLNLCLIYHFPYLFSFLFFLFFFVIPWETHLAQKTQGALLSSKQSHFYHRRMQQELLMFWRKPQSMRMWWHVMIVDLWWFKELDVRRIRDEDWNCFLKGWNLRKNQRTWVGNQMGVLLNCLNHNQWVWIVCFY